MCWNRIKSSFSKKISLFAPRQKLGAGLLFIGLVFLGIFFSFKLYDSWQRNDLGFTVSPPAIRTKKSDPNKLPQKIIIPHLKIDLAIEEAEILAGEWQVSASGASHLVQSALPGEKGNMIIYGHNRSYLFGSLRWAKQGEEILIKNKKGEPFIYEIIETKVVSPEQIEVLSPTEEPTLTLYTCFGFLDSKRFVVVGKFKRVI